MLTYLWKMWLILRLIWLNILTLKLLLPSIPPSLITCLLHVWDWGCLLNSTWCYFGTLCDSYQNCFLPFYALQSENGNREKVFHAEYNIFLPYCWSYYLDLRILHYNICHIYLDGQTDSFLKSLYLIHSVSRAHNSFPLNVL
jgi:hypothetical protein